MTLRIAPGLALPTDAVGETFAVIGRRSSGKTHTAGVLVEELLGAKLGAAERGGQVCPRSLGSW